MLSIRGLAGGYPGTRVLDGVDLEISEGEVMCLLGRNGVGKTTLAHTVMGMLPAAGSISFEGKELVGTATNKIARRGLALVPQGRRVFGPLTIEENLVIAARGCRRKGRWNIGSVYELFPRLRERRSNRGDTLSGGEQEMLSIGRALVMNPRLLVMDEPSDGLAPSVVNLVGDVVQALTAEGVTVLLIEQNLSMAMRLATKVAVMKKGKIVFLGLPNELRADTGLVRDLLGVG